MLGTELKKAGDIGTHPFEKKARLQKNRTPAVIQALAKVDDMEMGRQLELVKKNKQLAVDRLAAKKLMAFMVSLANKD